MSKITSLIMPGNYTPQQTLVDAMDSAQDGGYRSVAVVFETPQGEINAMFSTQNIADLALKARMLQIVVDRKFTEKPDDWGENNGGKD